ncbi:Tripeptidyl-peptidase sed1 [Lachnellula suecica]|uniref:Tripeptidyl-peptidase sed1 n=1 Tax=Lachnellula suecica TaxID=602035 RepID=A0A8T9CGH8_9HELO|nr:Tripeptidyl-peptidase sed1 [Lachnellula suecica]
MRASILVLAAVCSVPYFAVPTADPRHFVLHEKRDGAPHQWAKRTRAHPDEVLPVRIGLTQSNLHRAEEYILDVSDPRSPNFGKHWSAEKVANVFAPAKKTHDGVVDWLVSYGIDASRHTYSTGRNWIQVNATVAETEKLFNTEYHYYEHELSGGYRIACDEYHLPQNVREHVDFAMPTIQLEGMRPIPNLLPKLAAPSPITNLNGLENCSTLVTIECLRALYQFGAGNTSAPGNEIGIGEWADFLYEPDLVLFFKNFTTPQIPADVVPDFISIDGGQTGNFSYDNATGAGVESALDVMTAYSIIWPQQVRLYQVGDGVNVDSVGTFNIFLDALDASYCTYLGGDQPYVDPAYPDPNEGGYTGPLQCGGAPISNVFSFSYNQIEAALPVSYQQRQCNEWMKMGLQGVSVLFASGDSGVANRYNSGYPNSCLTPPEVGPYVDSNGTRFSPSFPTNCPWITAVGATQIPANGTISSGEIAVAEPNVDPKEDYYSGGGFSNVFPLPSYQSDAVTNYLTKYPPYNYTSDIFNNSGNARAYPDVAAIGLKIPTTYLGYTYGVGGTSASTPIWGGIVTLLNEARIAAGKGPIGFLNPTLYANPDAFNDITSGGNPGCGTKGFDCQPGWDPVTGLGSPIYPKLEEIFLSLP